MKNFKRLFAIVLSVALLLCSVPMIAFADADTIPEKNNTYKEIAGFTGKINGTTVPAGVNMYHGGNPYRMADWLPDKNLFNGDVMTKAEFVEVDVYVSVATSSIGFWVTDNWDASTTRQKINLGALEAGWNHKVFSVPVGAGYNWNSIFWEGVPSSTEDVTVVYANLSVTAENPVPDMNNTYEWAYDSVVGTFWTRDGIAGAYQIPPTGSDNGAHWYGHLSKTYDTTNAKFAELEIYSSVAIDGVQVWISSAAWADAGRARMEQGFDLVAGWNHVVVDLNNLGISSGTLNRAAVKNIYLEATTPADASDVTLKMGNLAFTTDVPFTPEVANKYFDVQEIKVTNSQFNSGEMTVPAGAGMYPNYQWWTQIEAIEMPANAFIEMDLYASADTSDFAMWIGSDSSANRPRYTIPALKKGWNHVVIDVDKPGHVNGSWSADSCTLTGTYFEGSLSADTDVTIIRKNMWVTTSDLAVPERNPVNKLVEVAGVSGQMATPLTVPAGASLYPGYQMWKTFDPAVDMTEAEFIEMDIYVSKDTNSIRMWSGTDGAAVRGFWMIPALTAGWNHVVIDKTAVGGANGGWSIDTFTEWTGCFFEGTLSASDDVTIHFANMCVTRTKGEDEPDEPEVPVDDPNVAPEPAYTANVMQTSAADLAGSKTNNTDERYMTWDEYSVGFADMIANPLDITKGDYIEFDFYSSVKTSGAISLGSKQNNPDVDKYGFQFYDNRSLRKEFEVKAGWNHIVLTTDGNFRQPDPTTMATYDSTEVTGFILHSWGASDYIRLTNIAVTRNAPLAVDTYQNPMIDAMDGQVFQKTWDAGVTNIYDNVADRAFIGFGRSIDMTKAEFVEFDVWVDNEINNLTFWVCNNFDATGRKRQTVDFSGLVANEWNHIVLNTADWAWTEGTMDLTNWNSCFFEGGPTDGLDHGVTIKIANMGVSKSYPDMDNVHTLVGTAFEGVAKNNTPNTVPAGASLYPTYQMWQSFAAVDMTNADFIELDIYATAPTNEFSIWTATDGAADRAKYAIPALEEGWNHVVIDLVNDRQTHNGGWTLEGFTAWSGYFFEGSLSADTDVTLKIANVAATKFAPDAKYDFIEVTSHPEIYVDVTGADNAYAGSDTFDTVVDLAKGDTIELDVYVEEGAQDITATFTDENGLTGAITIATDDLAVGWNHVVLNVADIVGEEGFTNRKVVSVEFSGVDNLRFVFANFAITAEEAVKFDMEYVGKVLSKFEGYNEVKIPAGAEIFENVDPIQLAVPMDITTVDYIEMNLYVSAKCDLTFYINATPLEEGDIYDEAAAYYVLEGLTYGWNQLHIPVADLIQNDYFGEYANAVNYIYFAGVPAATYEVTFTVEDLAATTNAIDFDIAEGDYNVDGSVDMLDLVQVVNYTLAEENTWFANVAEVESAADSVINALDIAGLRKLLFAAF